MTESNALPMPSHPAGSRRHYQTDGRERVLLVLALGLGFLTADLCLAMWYGVPALGVTLLVLLWEGTLLWYAREGTGLPEKAKRGAGLGLTVAVVLLGLCFSLCVSWLWLLNALALLALLVLQMFQLFGPARRAWSSPLMLAERGFLLLDGLFGQLGAPFQLLLSRKRERGRRRLCILLGLCCVIPLLMLVAPLLASADALFDRLTAETLRFLYEMCIRDRACGEESARICGAPGSGAGPGCADGRHGLDRKRLPGGPVRKGAAVCGRDGADPIFLG